MELTTRLLQFEWIGGPRLPSSVVYFAGEVRNEPVDWNDGGVLVTVWKPSVASTEITTDTQISGSLYATANGLSFNDGTNIAAYPCAWLAQELLTVIVKYSATQMQIGLVSFDSSLNEILLYGTLVSFDGDATFPVALSSNAIGSVSRVIILPGNPSEALIKKVVGKPDSFSFDLLRNVEWTNLADKDW